MSVPQIGKWHAGMSREELIPIRRGFNHSLGLLGGACGHYDYLRCKGYPDKQCHADLWRDGAPAYGETGTYSTDLFTDEAVRIIREHDTSTPLFIFLAYTNVHGPFESPTDLYERYWERGEVKALYRHTECSELDTEATCSNAKGWCVWDGACGEKECGDYENDRRTCRQNGCEYSEDSGQCYQRQWLAEMEELGADMCYNPVDMGDHSDACYRERQRNFLGMLSAVDESVANVTRVLKARGMWDNTLLIFSSDNGGVSHDSPKEVRNLPLRGSKGGEYEGGVRVASFAAGGLIPAEYRGQRVDGLMHLADWYATFCTLAGGERCAYDPVAAEAGLPQPDSLNMWPMISGTNKTSPRTELMLCSGRPGARKGKHGFVMWPYKLLLQENDDMCNTAPCLFDLRVDEGERTDLFESTEPDLVAVRHEVIARNHSMSMTYYQQPGSADSDVDGQSFWEASQMCHFWSPWQDDCAVHEISDSPRIACLSDTTEDRSCWWDGRTCADDRMSTHRWRAVSAFKKPTMCCEADSECSDAVAESTCRFSPYNTVIGENSGVGVCTPWHECDRDSHCADPAAARCNTAAALHKCVPCDDDAQCARNVRGGLSKCRAGVCVVPAAGEKATLRPRWMFSEQLCGGEATGCVVAADKAECETAQLLLNVYDADTLVAESADPTAPPGCIYDEANRALAFNGHSESTVSPSADSWFQLCRCCEAGFALSADGSECVAEVPQAAQLSGGMPVCAAMGPGNCVDIVSAERCDAAAAELNVGSGNASGSGCEAGGTKICDCCVEGSVASAEGSVCELVVDCASISDGSRLSADCRCDGTVLVNECARGRFCWRDSTCQDEKEENECVCRHGTPKSSAACTEHGATQCASCHGRATMSADHVCVGTCWGCCSLACLLASGRC